MDVRALIHGPWFGYPLAIVVMALAALLRWALPGALAGTPYLAFYPAVVAAAAFGGFGPGLLATVGSFLCVDLLFDTTPGGIDFGDPVVLGRMAIFCGGGIGISLVAQMRRAALARERRQARELDELVAVLDLANVLVLDPEDRIVRWSTGCRRLYGFTAEQALGRISRDLLRTRFPEPLEAIRSTLAATGRWEGELVHTTAGGREVVVTSEWILHRDAAGKPAAILETHTDITDRKAVERALSAAKTSAERAKSMAEEANRAKDHFLAVLSHELRTPLTPVAMGVSMLQSRPDLDSAMRETLETIRRNVEMEAHLIDDLLDVTRIARGKIDLTRSPVELCTVIHRAVEVCKPDIEARSLHFGLDLGPAAPYWVEADVPRLQQVFWNLLKNAIKFTPHGGCVGVRCRPEEEHVVVEVNDSGIGIEPEALPHVFNAFEQADRSITQQFGGLGLGLAISKALVEMHGGTISAYSEGRNKGATFRIRLPMTAPAGQPQAPAPAVPQQRRVRPLRILLVEDHGTSAKMIQLVLASDGHEVEMAGDVATALELAGRQGFDLLISDLGLPDGSGHDLMCQLRQRGHQFPGIALSGYGQEEDIRRSHAAGFAVHLTKPASAERLAEAIASVTAGQPQIPSPSGRGPG